MYNKIPEIYSITTFPLDCKGDVCLNDEIYFIKPAEKKGNKESTIVVGKVVNESYGEVVGQHTFTIELYYTKPTRPLMSLMLIKGRKLYKCLTKRRKWDDENERMKLIKEKHDRGFEVRKKFNRLK
jgi:hypothetical protein